MVAYIGSFHFRFVLISPSTLHWHASVWVNHARTIIVFTVLSVVIGLVSVGIIESYCIWLGLLHVGVVRDLLRLVVGGVIHYRSHGCSHGLGHGHGITGF